MTDKPTVHLRIRRADLIDQIIGEVQAEHAKNLRNAEREVQLASQKFVDAVGVEALRIAQPVINELTKLSGVCSWRADFRWQPEVRIRYRDDREYEPHTADRYVIRVTTEERFGHSGHNFQIPVVLTPLLLELRKAALDAEKARAELGAQDKRIATMKVETSRKIIREAIRNLPEGEKLLEAVRQLRIQAEASVLKNKGKVLLPES